MLKIFDLYRELQLTNIIIITRYECGHEEEQDMLYMGINEKKQLIQQIREESVSSYSNFDIQTDFMGMDGKLILIKEEKGKCKRCYRPEIIRCCDMPRPIGFDGKEFYHGVDAYNFDNPMQNLSDLLAHPEWEICTSTKALGTLGVVCTGDVVTASSIDLASYVIDGQRCFVTTKRAVGIVNEYDQLDNTMWNHDEIVMKNTNIRAFWIRDNSDSELKDKLIQKAVELGIDFYVLDNEGNRIVK